MMMILTERSYVMSFLTHTRWPSPSPRISGYQVDECQFRSIRPFEHPMTTEPNTDAADDTREKLVNAVRDEPLIKQLLAGIDATEICDKAVAVLRKRIDSGGLSDNMLLRIIDSLAKSTAYVAYIAVDRPPKAKRRAPASRLGRQSRRAPIRRTHGQSR
jgi:hypothetical protein